MADLEEYQFEVDGVVFGVDRDVCITPEGFDPAAGAWRTQDSDHPLTDGMIMGRDVQGGMTWGFDMFTNMDSSASALRAAAELRTVWPRDEIRLTPQAFTSLRYNLGGRTRRVFGRPRRWTSKPSNLLASGNLAVVADFQTLDSLVYSDVEQSIKLTATPILAGQGLKSPLKTPVKTAYGTTPKVQQLIVDGDRPTWPIIEFRGGINGWVRIGDWRCRLLASLNWDETATVDTRPWVRSSTIYGGLVPLDPESRLQNMSLPRGRYDISYGWDDVSDGDITVRWRDAYSSL